LLTVFAAAFMPATAALAWQRRNERDLAASRPACGRTSFGLTLSRLLQRIVA